jgi:dTDP-glucose pyrophosphorylase
MVPIYDKPMIYHPMLVLILDLIKDRLFVDNHAIAILCVDK